LAVLRFELRALSLLGGCCHASAPFALGVFLIESCVYIWASLDLDSPIYASHIAGMTAPPYPLPPNWPQTVTLPISASQEARIMGMSHQHPALFTSLMWAVESVKLQKCLVFLFCWITPIARPCEPQEGRDLGFLLPACSFVVWCNTCHVARASLYEARLANQ
jgi:hypothetical protein